MLRRIPTWLAALAPLCVFILGCGGSGDDSTGSTALKKCVAPAPPAEATRKMGEGSFLLPDGRALTPAGTNATLGGFPVELRVHPSLPLLYVSNTGYASRSLQVVERATGKIVQQIDRAEAFYGMALSADATRLYASGGDSKLLEAYDVGADGKLTAAVQVEVGGYPAGIAVSADGSKLWVAQFMGEAVSEIDVATFTVTSTTALKMRGYAVVHIESRNELYVSGFGDKGIAVVDLTTHTLAATIAAGGSPDGLAVSGDGKKVYASISESDAVVAIDTATRAIVDTQAVGEPSIADADGQPYPASSPAGIALDEAGGRLFVVRAADNAVSLLDPATLEPKAAIPVGWYPTSVALAGQTLLVLNAKGVGAGPLLAYGQGDESGKDQMAGSISIVDLASADLPALTAQVESNVRRPSTVYPFDCDGEFPIPIKTGGKTPIEHVLVIVRENKTYDTVLGDLEAGERDPNLVLYGEPITPNLHALARQFAHHDNFYDDSETSIQGHLWLTSSFVNDYMERTWLEDYRGNSGYAEDGPLERGQPDFGTFFTHLLKHHVDFTDYGEVVGSFGSYQGESVANHVDLHFPGVYWNTNVKDEIKAQYVAEQLIDNDTFPPFVFLVLPNDHTQGTGPNSLTPQAMINDNDYGTGLLIDRISHSKWWKSTAIFLVEDDPQIGADHVDYHRSIALVISPWAKHGYISHVHASYPALFSTWEHILGVPPMNRYDALATPLWDVFTMEPNFDTYTALPRSVPDEKNGTSTKSAPYSMQMDFSGPDRNPDLGAILWWAAKGAPSPGSRIAREVAAGLPPTVRSLDGDDARDVAEHDVFEDGWRRLDAYLAAHPEKTADLRPRLSPPVRRAAAVDDD